MPDPLTENTTTGTDVAIDAIFDALHEAGMEVVYATSPGYHPADSDARGPMKAGLIRALSMIGRG